MSISVCQIVTVVLSVAGASHVYSSPPPYAQDYLPHTALEKVPAKIGDNVQLRCTKILEQMASDYIETTYTCDPSWDKNCFHTWSKDGEILDVSYEKYVTKSSITYDYCENFEWTTDLIKGFGSIVDLNSGGNKYDINREMACYASSLTIRNVSVADFGEYKCNLSYHSEKKDDNYWRNIASSAKNITLYNIDDATVKQPVKVDYFQKYYTKGLKGNILVQCVTTGGELKWNVNIKNSEKPVPLERLNEQDFWRCFNFSENHHSPHTGITESFVYFDRVCTLDDAQITCSVGKLLPKNDRTSTTITVKRYWYYDDYSYYGPNWERDTGIAIASLTVIPVVLAMLIIFAIFAVIRAKMCECCKAGSNSPMVLGYQNQVHCAPQPVQ